MELNQLQYFKVVAETEHITHAAEKLNISQPALSRTILRLEDSIGTKLFNRDKNRITLNDTGQIFLKRAERALMEIEDGVKEIRALKEEKSSRMRFSITESGFITGPLVSFMMENPDLHVEQYIQSNEDMRASIENGDVDFGISFSPIESDIIEWVPLISEEILAFAGVTHPLADKNYISLNELKNERFLFNNSSYNIRHTICDYCRRIGFEPDIFYEGFENEVSDKLVENGMGILFVPSTAYVFHFREYPPSKILANPIHLIETVGQRVMGISLRRSHYMTSASRDFYHYILNYFNISTGRID